MTKAPQAPASGSRSGTDRWPGTDRIVVLPFEIEGADPAVARLATGLAHDIIASMARVSGIVVLARPSTEASLGTVGRVPAEVGRHLGADLVLDTSIRIVGDRVVFVSRLLDVRLERPIWADVYDGTRADLLDIRRRLLHELLAAAGLELSAAERDQLARGQTASPAAFELYLEAHSRLGQRTEEDVEASIQLLQDALAIDPAYALAQVGLMEAYSALHPAAGRRLSETGVLARRAGRAALELDPDLGEVYATFGLLRSFVDQDWHGSVADLRRAITLSPGHASAHHWLGAILTFVWRNFGEGARELEIARQLDPRSPAIRGDIGLAQLNRGDLTGARSTLTELAAEQPGFWRAPYFLGLARFVAGEPEAGVAYIEQAWRLGAFGASAEGLAAAGNPAKAGGDWRDTLLRRLAILRTSAVPPGMRAVEGAVLSALLGRRAEAIGWLNSVSQHSSAAWIMSFLPVFEPLRHEPGFRKFVVDAGLEEFVEP